MGRLVLWIFVVLLVVVGGGLIWLGTADVPKPVVRVEKLLPNAPAAP